jgi:mannose-6-phosphate isomerase-like protein (cupin superfamily)
MKRTEAQVIQPGETKEFQRSGFRGEVYVENAAQLGFDVMRIVVAGGHPVKQIEEGNTRNYFVIAGQGNFTINGEVHEVEAQSFMTLPAGTVYSYSGEMQLLEFNVSPDNSFGSTTLS